MLSQSQTLLKQFGTLGGSDAVAELRSAACAHSIAPAMTLITGPLRLLHSSFPPYLSSRQTSQTCGAKRSKNSGTALRPSHPKSYLKLLASRQLFLVHSRGDVLQVDRAHPDKAVARAFDVGD